MACFVGLVSAGVLAASPNPNTNQDCSGKLGGNLRVLEAASDNSCAVLENLMTATSFASHIAHAGFNDDGSLNTAYSTNMITAKIVPSPGSSTNDLCFAVSFTPRSSITPLTPNGAILRVYGASEADLIDQRCGTGYNAAVLNVETATSSDMLPTYNVTFFN